MIDPEAYLRSRMCADYQLGPFAADGSGPVNVLRDGVPILEVAQPFAQLLWLQFYSLILARQPMAARQLLNGFVFHRDIMAALAAGATGTPPVEGGTVVPGPWPGAGA